MSKHNNIPKLLSYSSLIAILALGAGCGAWFYDGSPRNSDLVVTYYGDEEYRAKKPKPIICSCDPKCPLHKKTGEKNTEKKNDR